MPFFIETFDLPDPHDLRLRTRPAHLDFLDAHQGSLLACGAKTDDRGVVAHGGVYLLDTDRRDEAEAFIRQDPFWQAGLFASVTVHRWRKAYFNFDRHLTD